MRRINLLFIVFTICYLLPRNLLAQEKPRDVLVLGNVQSEEQHGLKSENSKIVAGALSQTARILLPREPLNYTGGTLAFRMQVDPVKQNYFTVKCWGSDKDKSMLMLFSEGKQVGYRHLGDIDLLFLGNNEAPLAGRFFYVTLPIPLNHTKGKKEVNLEIRSYGEIWGYGDTFERYQKDMTAPTMGLYKVYTHTSTLVQTDKASATEKVDLNASIRNDVGEEVLVELKERLNKELDEIINADRPIKQLEIMFVAPAYHIKWTHAYQNPKVIRQVIAGIDEHYRKFVQDPDIVYSDKSVYNYEWLITGPLSRGIRELYTEIKPQLDEEISNGKGAKINRRTAWSDMLQASLKYSTTHRRQYTNQSMIIDLFMYDCNRALLLIDPAHALPEFQILRYLYESVGLVPWLGKETANGPQKPLGDDYWQLTAKGLTKELGFVGYYGEVLDWVVDIYKSTCAPGVPHSGDAKIRQQLLKMMRARSYFRYPALDADGNKAMRAEAVVGWRDGGHYPGNVMYGDRGTAWDATPLMTAAATLDEHALGYAQQMLKDNQFFNIIKIKLKDKGIRASKSLLYVPDEYELIKKQADSKYRLPMTPGMPDFVFADEEDGVIAIKNGEDILYASLYWRARNAVNRLAKVHYITPTTDVISNIYIEQEFEPSGMEYVRRDWVNLGFQGSREWYKGISSAHAGEVQPIAKIPEGVPFRPGDENAYAGKADFYKMQFGKYLVGMNSSKGKTFKLQIPEGYKKVKNLTTGKYIKEKELSIDPISTTVIYFEK
ncbi:hypothetical protein [Desertivirga xinjiangensis]|uniref:hypothetical protein n=1 Tax=Desertivirga xinjiangensis TaxID=539206 RepID=UPI00210E6DA0|nr:hypothetical protein [Pedobacter xinjiangensis]